MKNHFMFKLACSIFAVILLGLIFLLSLNLFWSDSEMWAATVARSLFSQIDKSAYELKPAFYLPLWLSYQTAQFFHVFPMEIARPLFFINAVAIAGLSFLIAERMFQKPSLKPWLVLLLILTSGLFLERSYSVRSDILVSSLCLGAIYFWLKKVNSWTSIFLLAVSFFVSLNVLFFLPIIFCFLPSMNWKSPKLKYYAVGCMILLILLIPSIPSSLQFFIDSFSSRGGGNLSYFSAIRFEHIKRWILKDPHIFVLIALKLSHDLIALIRRKPIFQSKSNAIGYWILILFVFYPNRLPFFLVSLLPFLILWTLHLPLLELGWLKKIRPQWAELISFSVILALFIHAAFYSKKLLETHNNKLQIEVMQKLEDLVPRSAKISIFDPVGLLPYHQSYLWYLGPGQTKENQKIAELFRKVKPKLVLDTQRLEWIKNDIAEEFKNYQVLSENIWLRHSSVKKTSPYISREAIFSQLEHSYSDLITNEWQFQFAGMAEDNESTLALKAKDFEGKVFEVQGAFSYGQLLYVKALIGVGDLKFLEIYPTLPLNWQGLPSFKILFRFDSQL